MQNYTATIMNLPQSTLDWLTTNGLSVLAIVVGLAVGSFFILYILRRAIRRVIERKSDLAEFEKDQRIKTLQRVAGGTVKILVSVVGAMIILTELGLNIGPLLATAGVAGVALGFGAQYLVNDVITGFFILIENQYSVGDVICLNDTCGVVEKITLRMTRLRDLDGVVHHVPNSHIEIASNMSKKFSRINVDVGVSYDADIDEVIEVINRVGQQMAEDPDWEHIVKKAPEFLRVDEFADSAVVLKVLGEVKPAEQWDASGEFRKRLKKAFDDEGIEIPYPQRVIHNSDN